jgi:hypothetical protein
MSNGLIILPWNIGVFEFYEINSAETYYKRDKLFPRKLLTVTQILDIEVQL